MHTHRKHRWNAPAALSLLALTLWIPSAAQADTLEGLLERGSRHSVLWFASPESGDLIGQVFTNTSQAGQVILAHCLPDMACTVEGASTGEADEALLARLQFSDQPSGWWLIEQAKNAYMQPNLPLSKRALETRFGALHITDEQRLVFKGRPVLVSPPPALANDTQPSPEPASNTSQPSLLNRIQTWWNTLWSKLQDQMLVLLGRTPQDSALSAPAPSTPAAQPPAPPSQYSAAEEVQGNNALHIVAHLELQGSDIVLLQDTGGTGCPALYRFATLTLQGIAVTPEFGTCSDIASIRLPEPAVGAAPAPIVSMVGFMGPVEPPAEQARAAKRLHRFVLHQGQVQEQIADSPDWDS